MTFAGLWASLLPVGRDPDGAGYRRITGTRPESECRAWFQQAAAQRALRAHTDRNGNLWAWWDAPETARAGAGAVVTGSHLDSVPGGGAFDGALGVVSGFAAIDVLRGRGFTPARPLAVAAFCEEEGARFGVACLGSRLLVGSLDPEVAKSLRDGQGKTLPEVMAGSGQGGDIGADEDLLSRIAVFVELHIEQGQALEGLGARIGLGERIWPHARWRFDFTGQADHAGTALLDNRRDPMLPAAAVVLAARAAAEKHGALATVGKLWSAPGAANAVAAAVTLWLDVRAPEDGLLALVADEVSMAGRGSAAEHDVRAVIRQESATAAVEFDPMLRERLSTTLAARGIPAPPLPTGAGHDAGVLAARLPTAMLFVRNPSGVSHSPTEHADISDCEVGVNALAAVLEDLASG